MEEYGRTAWANSWKVARTSARSVIRGSGLGAFPACDEGLYVRGQGRVKDFHFSAHVSGGRRMLFKVLNDFAKGLAVNAPVDCVQIAHVVQFVTQLLNAAERQAGKD